MVSGFPWITPFQVVKEKTDEIVNKAGITDAAPMTTRKMTSFGYIKFKDIETKKRFKKWLGVWRVPSSTTRSIS